MPVPIAPRLASTQAPVRVPAPAQSALGQHQAVPSQAVAAPLEIGGPDGPEPTRYGDWERRGRCIDF